MIGRILICTAMLLVFHGVAVADHNQYGIQLAPGEVLVSVNGVPVNRSVVTRSRTVTRSVTPVANALTFPVRATRQVMRCTVDAFGQRSCR